jgi:Mrp family chromosome partitioning ATPase
MACLAMHSLRRHETNEETFVLKIVLAQQKGGAAKTTLCVHLAVAAEQAGLKAAIIDTDPQGSA